MIRPKQFNRGNIYLSGGMQFAANLGAGWRVTASEKLKAMEYFPLDITDLDVAYNVKHGKLSVPLPGAAKVPNHKPHDIAPNQPEVDAVVESYSEELTEKEVLYYKANMRKHFVQTDLDLIEKNSDALIVYYDESARRGAGTVSEAQFAYNMNIPIFLVCEYATEAEMFKNVSGWLVALATKHFLTFDALYEYLDKLPHGIMKKDIYGNHSVGQEYLCHLSGEVFEKKKHKFVSRIHPLYSQKSVDVVTTVNEEHKDRYDFFLEHLSETTGTDFIKDK